jgi:uncharacterized membrane protein
MKNLRRASGFQAGSPLVFLMAGHFILFLLIGILRQETYFYGKLDTAYYQQGLWLAGHFKNPVSTLYTGWNVFLGHHFQPLGFIYGLLFLICEHVSVLVVLDAFHSAAAAIPLYLLAQHFLKNRLISLGFVASYFLSYTLLPRHFYFENLSIPFTFSAILLTVKKKYWTATLFWLLSISFKEYMGLMFSAAGAVVFLKQNKRVGFLWALAGFLWFALAYAFARKVTPDTGYLFLYSNLGDSMPEIIKNLILRPDIWLGHLFRPKALEYFSGLLSPLFFLPLAGPEFLLPSLPLHLINVLAAEDWCIGDPLSHYSIMTTPYLTAAAIIGLARVRNGVSRWCPRGVKLLAVIIFAGFILGNYKGASAYAYHVKEAFILRHIFKNHSQDVLEVRKQIPPDISVVAEERLLPVFAMREKVFYFPTFEKGPLNSERLLGYDADAIVLDVFYDQAWERGGGLKALALGWKALKTLPEDYYNRAMFENLSGEYALLIERLKSRGYTFKQTGSLLFFQKKIRN